MVRIKDITLTPNPVFKGQSVLVVVTADEISWKTIKDEILSWQEVKNGFDNWGKLKNLTRKS